MSERQSTIISGGRGFLGRYVTEELKQSGQIVRVGTSRQEAIIDRQGFILLDPKDGDNFNEVIQKYLPDNLIHMSALSSPAESEKNKDAWLINVGSVENALKALLLAKSRNRSYDPTFVFYSSVEVFGDGIPGLAINEETIKSPKNKYAEMKIAAEEFVQRFCGDNNIKYLIVQQGQTIGVGQDKKFLIPKVVSQLADIVTENNISYDKDGHPYIETGYVGNKRTLLDARDSAQAIKRLLDSKKYGTYIVCGDNNQTLDFVIKQLISLAKIATNKENLDIQHVVAKSIAGYQPDRRYDNSNLKNATKWLPRYSLHDTLKWIMYSELAERSEKVR